MVTSPKRVLVIDDEETILDLCWHVLTYEGYDVKLASSGEEALTIASSEQVHMVVTDMVMPGMDGLQTFLSLRETQSELIGVLITAHGTLDAAIKAMQHGFSDFLRKPFTPVDLAQVVENAFHKAALTEENARLKTLLPLYSLGEKFIRSRTKKEVVDELVETLYQQTGVERISVMLYDGRQQALRIAAARGISEDVVRNVRIRPGERIAGRVFEEGKPIILNGTAEDNPGFARFLNSREIVAAISFPLKARDRTLGVVNISKLGQGAPFSQADIEMLSVICDQAVMALENLRIMAERAERMRMRTLFEQYVAPEVAQVLISHGKNPLDIGEIRNITVLFADIRNFTPLVQHVPLQTLRSFLNDFFALLTVAIYRSKGTLDKFMGDAVLAFFGAPVPLDEPNRAAVRSAVTMHRAFADLKRRWQSTRQPLGAVGLGIGISSGEMFLGNVGSRRRFDYTVIGTDVNLAQRLASEALSGQILITQSVRDGIGREWNAVREPLRVLKGMDRAISVYSISSARWGTRHADAGDTASFQASEGDQHRQVGVNRKVEQRK
jgi:adenylate cyclase